MNLLGNHIAQMTLSLGPAIILMGFVQYLFFKHVRSYSDRTIEELNDKSFLGLEGTFKTKTGGKIMMVIGLIVFLVMVVSDLVSGPSFAESDLYKSTAESMQNNPGAIEDQKGPEPAK